MTVRSSNDPAARLRARVEELEGVLRAVDQQFRVYGNNLPDGFDFRVLGWVSDALAGTAFDTEGRPKRRRPGWFTR
jgi:hypothetical protein